MAARLKLRLDEELMWESDAKNATQSINNVASVVINSNGINKLWPQFVTGSSAITVQYQSSSAVCSCPSVIVAGIDNFKVAYQYAIIILITICLVSILLEQSNFVCTFALSFLAFYGLVSIFRTLILCRKN